MASEKNNYANDKFLEQLYILDSSYTTKFVIDTFSDFLWTERYYGYGEFEITMPVDRNVIENCRLKDYVSIRESDKIMIIETITVHTDPENGDTLTISGRSLESLLDRRIIIDEIIGTFDEDGVAQSISVQDAIQSIIVNNLVSASDSKRITPSFSFITSDDEKITSLTMESFQELGTNVYDKICDICKDKDIGFRVNAKSSGGFIFELYAGVDRSSDQSGKSIVTFSESYENLTNSDYLRTETNYKSNVYVQWSWRISIEYVVPVYDEDGKPELDDKGNQVTQTSTEQFSGTEITEVYRKIERTGLERREIYTTYSNQFDFGTYSYDEFDEETLRNDIEKATKQVTDYGEEFLADYKVTKLFEGETNPYRQFTYGIDYMLGDIVQLQNKYGQSGKCRITELMLSRDASGPMLTPTFEGIEENDED